MSKANKELLHLFGDKSDWNVVKKSDFETLTECTELIDAREFKRVIDKVSEYVIEHKVLDIQFLCLYLEAHFNLNHSADDYISSLNILVDVLSKYELISPINKKETIVIRSILTLINNSNDSINYYYPDFSDSQQETITECLGSIEEFLSQNIKDLDLLEFSDSKNKLMQTVAKYLLRVYKEIEVGECVIEKPLTVSKPSKQDLYSFAWTNLLLKMSKLSGLSSTAVESHEKFELALLFDSIQEEISSFNPIKYFPREFEVFLNLITPEAYTDIQQIIENSKGSPLWEFMLQKTEVNIQIDPDNKQSEIGDFNLDDILKKSSHTKTMDDNNQANYSNNEIEHKYQEDNFSSAFDNI